MFSLSDILFYLVTLAILILLTWRPVILPLIAKVRPELWLKLSDWNRVVDYDKTKALVAERKAKRDARRGSKENATEQTDGK
jgi:hypothetical protein